MNVWNCHFFFLLYLFSVTCLVRLGVVGQWHRSRRYPAGLSRPGPVGVCPSRRESSRPWLVGAALLVGRGALDVRPSGLGRLPWGRTRLSPRALGATLVEILLAEAPTVAPTTLSDYPDPPELMRFADEDEPSIAGRLVTPKQGASLVGMVS